MDIIWFEDFFGVRSYLPDDVSSEITWISPDDTSLESDPRFQVFNSQDK